MSEYCFEYLKEKIKKASFIKFPFKHLYIENFFNNDHFDEIINSKEIAPPLCNSDKTLINGLIEKGFSPITMAGATINVDSYIELRNKGEKLNAENSACEALGVVLRLEKIKSSILKSVTNFLYGENFNKTVAEKFEIKFDDCFIDGGIQKYLDGYEISPHPDIRRKATTFMININPSKKSEKMNHHTHYSILKNKYSYLREFWEYNKEIDRCWIPWDWTQTIKQQTKNNSVVLFSPDNDTIHAVKANYDHLVTQRTQLYGNLWYKNPKPTESLKWEELDIKSKLSPMNTNSQSSEINLNINQITQIMFDIKNKNPKLAQSLKEIL